MSHDDYHSDRDHVSRSDLVIFDSSRRRYKRHIDGLDTTPETDALTVGTGVHAVALRDVLQLDKMVRVPESKLKVTVRRDGTKSYSRNCNSYKQFKFASANRGKVLLTPAQFETCHAVADAMRKIEVAQTPEGAPVLLGELIDRKDALREFEHRWTEILPCRLKSDLIIPLGSMTLAFDLKTARSAAPRAFLREVVKRRLWAQDGHYSAGLEDKFQAPCRFCFVVCEKDGDFDSAVYELDPETRSLARTKRLQILEDMKKCRETGIYIDPPKSIGVQKLTVSAEEMGLVI